MRRSSRLAWAILAIAAACRSSTPLPAPVIDHVDPASAPNDLEVKIAILGRNFYLEPFQSLEGQPSTAGEFRAFLGAIELKDVQRVTGSAPTFITATVPAGLSVGKYDLTVEGPYGVSLPVTFEVTAKDAPGPDASTPLDADLGDSGEAPGLDAGAPDAIVEGADAEEGMDAKPDAAPADASPADASYPDAASAVDASAVDASADAGAAPDTGLAPDHDASQPDAAVCLDGEVSCFNAKEQKCTGGAWLPQRTCAAGCHATLPRCYRPVLTGIDQSWLDAASTDFNPKADSLLDSDLGTIDKVPLGADFHIIAGQPCGALSVETGTFVFKSVHVAAGITVRVQGSRAVAIVSAGDVLIEGVIDVSGGKAACPASHFRCAGPGGAAGGLSWNPGDTGGGPGGGTGGDGDGVGTGDEMGGGGGSHQGKGGRGGNDTVHPTVKGGVGGPTYSATNPACGGSGGGGGGAGTGFTHGSDGSTGGGGGGALLLGSLTSITIQSDNAGINAGGGGGQCDKLASYDDGGGGGGSGGTVTLEAPAIDLSSGAAVAANGGGGGGGFNKGKPLEDGTSGQLSAMPTPAGAGGGAGGAGADLDGLNAVDMNDGTGGGGGGAGEIVLRSVKPPGTAGAIVSPAEQVSSLPLQ